MEGTGYNISLSDIRYIVPTDLFMKMCDQNLVEMLKEVKRGEVVVYIGQHDVYVGWINRICRNGRHITMLDVSKNKIMFHRKDKVVPMQIFVACKTSLMLENNWPPKPF